MKKLMLFVVIISWTYNINAQCNGNLPINETFNTNTIGTCWQINDQDGDNRNWLWWEYSSYYGGHKVIASYSVSTSIGALNPDNWITSYPIDLTSFNSGDNIELSWKIRAGLSYAPHEYYTVYAATNNQISSFTSSPVKRSEYVDEVGGAANFVTRTLNLSALAGNTVYIAIRHHNSTNQSNIEIDEINITSGGSSGGCVSDSDYDGICDPDDQCPLLNNALIGTPCNDGDPCTINDIYNSNCGCSGSFADSDSDGICDAYDVCPGFDDSIDTNGNGIPDGCETNSCTDNTMNFANNPLTHSGSGSKSTTLTLPSGSQNISFTLSNIDFKLKGKQGSYYIERVVVTYIDVAGITKTNGTYRGDQISSASINIPDNSQSITIRLDNAFDGNSVADLSVSLSEVAYCGSQVVPCSDSDSDGVCDTDDKCPGFDDKIDTNGNGIPDGCESACVEYSIDFNKNPLTHSGNASSFTTLNLQSNSKDVSFTISNIDQKTKGKPGSEYVERVIVSYVDGSNVSKTYGTYNGANVSSATININGTVKSITVNLSDGLTGNTSSTMSIDLSAVSYCVNSSPLQTNVGSSKDISQQENNISKFDEPIENSFKIYPNPTSHFLNIKSTQLSDKKVNIILYNLQGVQVSNTNLNNNEGQSFEIDLTGISTGFYILHIIGDKGNLLKTERIIIK